MSPKLPTSNGSYVTTPRAGMMMELLRSGARLGSVTLTDDEFRAIKKLYGYVPAENELEQAGADRNAFRDAERDGLRLLAWIAKYVPVGEDPLKTLIQLADEAGMDVSFEDAEWALEGAIDERKQA